MKSITFYLLLIATAITTFSCKKDVPVSDSLIGTWELSVDVGGWSGTHYHKPGNDTLIKFTDNTYAFYQKGKLIKSGTYVTKMDTSYVYQSQKHRIIFDDENANYTHEFYDIKDNELSLFIDAYDADIATYRRIE